MSDTILITGGSGLLALNWACVARARHTVMLGLHTRQVKLDGVEARRLPLEPVEAILDHLSDIGPRLVVHTAGFTNVDKCEANPALAEHVNVALTKNVARACAALDIPLVQISTDHLFAGDRAWVSEDEPTAPQNVYARTKAEAELQVLAACPRALVVRTNFYGWGPSYRSSFSDSIIRPLRGGNTVTLFEDVFYTPVLIETLVEAVHDLVGKRASGIFHVVGDERVSKHAFGLRIANAFRLDVGLVRKGRFEGQAGLAPRPRDMSLSNEKTCGLLGRKLGGIDEHISRLCEQERNGLTREIQNQ